MREDPPEDIVGRARSFHEMITAIIDQISVEPADGGLQFRMIHRTNYTPGPREHGRWMVGYFVAAGGGNGEWSSPSGTRDGATLFEAVQRFYHAIEERDHDPNHD